VQDAVLLALVAFVCLYLLPRRIMRWAKRDRTAHAENKTE
jgi:hypothetical protein